MEVTLEKIELVRDRTGVSYKEAKDALEAAEGSVVDAIISIEESIDVGVSGGVTRDVAAKKDELVEKMKSVAKKGGVSKIRITRDGETIMNIPLVAGVLGAVLAPYGMIAGAVAALGFKCKIEFVKDDGSIVDISEKAGNVYETAKEKGQDIYSDIREKTPASFDEFKTRAQDTINDLRERAPESFDDVKTRAQGTFNDLKEKTAQTTDNPKFEEFKNKFDEIWEKGGEAVNKAKESVARPVKSFKEGLKDAAEEVEETLKDVANDFENIEVTDIGAEVAEGLEDAADDMGREMSQLEKDLLEMQKAAADGIKEFEEEVNN